ncbi:MAG TPA: hypothetical protein PLR35_12800 [Burkholderiaceae bacterium]|nr:hypothetical protein [Burkholderiaceae bacterium]
MAFGNLLGAFIQWPWFALVPVAAFGVLYARSRAGSALAAALAWLGYLVYKYAMKLRWLCSGECNIRVDLLVLYPLLLLVSLIALWRGLRGRR